MRRFGPKSADHPSVGNQCPLCHEPFTPGDYTTLASLGPADKDDASRKTAGAAFTAIAVEVHWHCLPEHLRDEGA